MKTFILNTLLCLLSISYLSGQSNKSSLQFGRTSIAFDQAFGSFIKINSDGSTGRESTSGAFDSPKIPSQVCVIKTGNGQVAFRSQHGKFLSAANGGGSSCGFTAGSIGKNEQFKLNHHGNGAFSIQTANGRYLSASSGKLTADGTAESIYKFYFATFALIHAHNGQHVTAETYSVSSGYSGGRCATGSYSTGLEFSASSGAVDAGTVWRIEDRGDGKVALSVRGEFLRVDNGELNPGDSYERQKIAYEYLGNGQFAFKQLSGGYMSARLDANTKNTNKTGKIIMTASRASTWEKFTILNPDRGMGEGCSNDAYLSHAVASNNKAEMDQLLAKGAKPNTEQLNMALKSNPEMAKSLLKSGAKPDATTVDMAVQKKDNALIKEAVEKGGKPTLGHFNTMIADKNYEIAELMTQKGGVMPTQTELRKAVDNKDVKAAQIITKKGVKGDIHMLNKSISANNKELYTVLVQGVQPNEQSLSSAMHVNNKEIFLDIIGRGVRCSKTHIRSAINDNSVEYTKLCIQNGSSANDGLDHAIGTKKHDFMELCMQNGADPNRALNYVVKEKQPEMGRLLVTTYKADADKLSDEALKYKNVELLKIAVVDGKSDPNRHLGTAAWNNYVDMTNMLLDVGADPNKAMTGVIKNKQVDLLKRCISMGASAQDPKHIEKAVELNSLPITNILLEAGASPDPGMSTAIRQDYYEILQALLAKGASTKGHLELPACNGKDKTVKLLLEYKADPNEGMKCATEKNYAAMTHMLLSAGAQATGYMKTPARMGYEQVVRHLVEFGAQAQEGLAESVKGNHESIVTFLLSKGAQPKDLVKIAADLGNATIVKALCDKGDAPGPGMLPAAAKGHVEVAEVLVGLGVDAKPYKFIRAAVDNNKAPMADYLLRQGTDVNHKAENDITLLHIAAGNTEAYKLVKVLLEHKADVNAFETSEGNTPLHVAVYHKAKKSDNNMETIRALVEAGAGVNNVNNVGKNGESVRKYARGGVIKKYIGSEGGVLNTNKAIELGGKRASDSSAAAENE